MDISKTIAEIKKDPAFAENVGMLMVHNGVVRAWSRQGKQSVTSIKVSPDKAHIEKIRQEMEQRPGIFRIVIECREGLLKPGDDVLFFIVAGDIRENVKAVFAELLDRIKSEAVVKQEYLV